MKIWVTRYGASGIMFRGLEQLTVHFKKPKWLIEPLTETDRDIPFGTRYDESRGFYKVYGWTPEHNAIPSLSVGKWIGYCEDDNPEKELSIFIWDKLCEHFLNEPFDNWCLLEREGRCKIENFLLEIEISLSICSNPKSNAEAPNY